MPQTENIVNGDFESGGSNWSGNDIETSDNNPNWDEHTYLHNGNHSNHVAEMDGNRTQTTVMEQSFTIDGPITTNVTFDAALRTSGDLGVDGFTVEVLDSVGNVISTMNVTPTANTLTGYSLPVTFTESGTYTLRLTEYGNDDSKGAIVDNISLLTCFTHGTLIETATGEKHIEELQAGDMIRTMDHGMQPIRWIGSSKRAAVGEMAPILIRKGTLGNTRDLEVSPQHRILLSGWQAELLFGEAQVFASAKSLINDKTIFRVQGGMVEYFHILFDQHEVVFSEGTPSESFHPNVDTLDAVDQATHDEILALLPRLAQKGTSHGPDARPTLNACEGTIFATFL